MGIQVNEMMNMPMMIFSYFMKRFSMTYSVMIHISLFCLSYRYTPFNGQAKFDCARTNLSYN